MSRRPVPRRLARPRTGFALAGALVAASPDAPTAPPAPAAPPAVRWNRTPDGLDVRLHVARSADEPPWVILVRLDPALHAVRVLAADLPGTRVDVVAAETGALAVVNGGFFDEAGRAMGWVVSDGRELSKLRAQGWAAFVVPAGGASPRILTPRAAAGHRAAQAIQAGPRLVVTGRPNQLRPQTARRSFVGIDSKGRVVLGCTGPLPADMRALARWLASPEREGGAELVDALALDGGSSAQLHVKDGSPTGGDLLLPSLVDVPNVLAVYPLPRSAPSTPGAARP